MKRIIELDDRTYEAIKINQYCGSKSDLESIIANSVPITNDNENSTSVLVKDIVGFDVSRMPKLPEYKESEKPKSMAEDLHDFLMNE